MKQNGLKLLVTCCCGVSLLALSGCFHGAKETAPQTSIVPGMEVQPQDQAQAGEVPMDASDLLAKDEGTKQSHHVEDGARPAEAPSQTDKNVAPIPNAGPKGSGVAEILWQVPKEQVEKYHLRYGKTPTDLPGYMEIKADELERRSDPVFGTVFRFLLRDIPEDSDIYITLQAENRHGLSPATEPMKIAPGTADTSGTTK